MTTMHPLTTLGVSGYYIVASESPPPLTPHQWSAICGYVSDIADGFARLPQARQASELKQARALRDDATRAGRHDSATYLQECIDDMTGAKE